MGVLMGWFFLSFFFGKPKIVRDSILEFLLETSIIVDGVIIGGHPSLP